ncbi:autotransporter-associated beta strand repeat-containing protein, partial [Sphingomonas sp. HITSZ_GF]|uniref:beta strand repeat-containing protein n=1 Tax=Sphingomonas sp. HITSZ_GF TaxID=3037247 RepID=UPI00240E3B1D
MIDRGNGARARKAISARVGREALLRKALLGSTALIGISLATPALAQTSVGGGTISPNGILTNNTATGGGVQLDGTSGSVTVTDVTIANTNGTPGADAYRQVAAGGQPASLSTRGANSFSTNQSGGAGISLTAPNGTISWLMDPTQNGSTVDLTGSYGGRFSTNGSILIWDNALVSSLRNVTANGTAVAGLSATAGTTVTYLLKAPTISGFAAGLQANGQTGVNITTTGGSIAASNTGVDADAGSGNITITSASNITAPTGIDALASGNVSITSSGTINGSGTPLYGIHAQGGGTVAITVNGAIGGTTPGVYGIWAQAGAATGNTIDVNANVTGTTAGIWTSNAGQPFTITVASGGTVTGAAGAAIDDRAGSTIVNNGALLAASGVSSTTVNMWNGGSLTNNGTMVSMDGYAFRTFGGVTSLTNIGTITGNNVNAGAIYLSSSAATTVSLAAGSTVNGRIFAYDSANSGTRTVTVAGALNGDYEAASGGDTAGDLVTLAATGSITGNVRLGGGNDTFNWNGGTLGGSLDAGAGTNDRLNVALGTGNSATLGSYSGFESMYLASGNLTIGSIINGYYWTINGGKLTLDGNYSTTFASVAVVNAGGTFELAAGRTITGANAVTANGTVINHGSWTGWNQGGDATVYASPLTSNSGLTLTNDGTLQGIDADYSTGVNLRGGTVSITNSGLIAGGAAGTTHLTNGIRVESATSVSVTNQTGGTIRGAIGFENISSSGFSLTNAGTVSGTTYGIVSSGTSPFNTVTINSTGTISGATGSIRLGAAGSQTVNLNAGSTTTGGITGTGTGARAITLAGLLTGGYDATANSNTAADTFTLASTGNITGAIALGDGNDSFTYQGGTFGSTIDGGAGTDSFAVDIGASTYKTLGLSSFTNFETFALTSGNLTLTGSRDGGNGWTVAGGDATTLYLNGALTNIAGVGVTLTTPDLMFVQSGAQLSATGDVIYSSGNGNNIQNSGTITSGTGLSSAIAIGSGTVDNYGTITYAAGGSIATQGNGVLASSNQLSLTNHTGATLIGRWDGARANNGAYIVNDGLIRGDRFAGVEITGISIVQNNATGRIYGATGEGSGLLINNGAVQVTNAGQIVGAGTAGIYNAGSGLLTLSNSGTIATGTLNGSNNYVQGGTTTAIRTGSANITNNGTIQGASGGIAATGALTLTNTGLINGVGTGSLALNAVDVGGVASILNSGTISEGTNFAISATGGGTITNTVNASLGGGNDVTNGYAVYLNNGTTFNNYGQAGSGTGGTVLIGSGGGTVNLFAGSASGRIIGGAGNDTLAIYSGQTNASAVTQTYTVAVSGGSGTVTLQSIGPLSAAIYGGIDLGTGNDTLQLRGAGTGAQAGSFSLATTTGAEAITKLDSGTWTLTGAAITPGIRINAGTGSAAGTLVFTGTTGLTGDIYVNGATIRATTAGAFGSSTIHMVDPTVQFGAAGTYANNFLLEVGTPASADPTIFLNNSGGAVTLSGTITTGSGLNASNQTIDTAQAVTFSGTAGSTFLVSGANNWSGATVIDTVTVTASGGAAIGDASAVTVNSGAGLTLAGSETIGGLAGAGAVELGGKTLTLGGNNASTTFTGTIGEGGIAYVGSWHVSDGPAWSTNPAVYSGVEAAALLFGGSASDYRISTNGTDVAQINDSVWMDGYGSHTLYATTPAADDLHLDAGAVGYNGFGDYSAYIQDDSTRFAGLTNYAFRAPTGGGLTKMGTGTLTLTGANTYTGTTTILGGTLALGGSGTLASSLIVNNAAFDIAGHTGAVSILNMTGTGTTALGANALTLTSASGTYSGAIGGTGALTVSGGGLYTLTGFSSYTGGTTVTGSGTNLVVGNGASSGRITGGISVDTGATLTFSRSDNYDFTSAISGAGTVQALGTVSLSGAITNTGALNVNSATGGTITLTGTRSSASVSAVTVAGSGNTLRVGLTGSVAGGQYLGVRLDGTGNGIDNFGAITNTGTGGDNGWGAAIGVAATSGTSVINNGSPSNSTATISGQNAGINHLSSGGVVATGLLTVNNYGLITGNLYNAVENQGGSGALTVTNYATGRIVGLGNSGGGNGISMAGSGALTLTNAGLILGRSNGVATSSTVNIINSGTITSGTLSGGTSGVLTLSGSSGIQAMGGTITNNAGGLIQGGVNGILVSSGTASALTVDNSGTIIGNTRDGIENLSAAGGTLNVNNYATGVITGVGNGTPGTGSGIATTNAVVTLNNAGVIRGLDQGVYTGASSFTLTGNTGIIAGQANGIFASGAATVTNSGTIGTGTVTGTVFTVGNGGAGLSIGSGTVTNNAGGLIASGNNAGLSFTGSGAAQLTNASGATIRGSGGVIAGSASTATITNSGTIETVAGSNSYGVAITSGTITNNLGGVIRQQSSSGQVAVYASGAATLINDGVISSVANTYAVRINGTATVTNSGSITSGNNVAIILVGTGSNSVTNSGTISGSYGLGASSGPVTITNTGTIAGTAAAIDLGYGAFDDTLNLNAGTISGAINVYAGADTINLRGGTVTGAIALGDGNDIFNWSGGSFASIDAGAGIDTLNVSLATATTLDLTKAINFETGNLLTGTLTLTGAQSGAAGWTQSDGTVLNIGAAGQAANLAANGVGVTITGANATITVAAGSALTSTNSSAVDASGDGLTVINAGTLGAILSSGANASVTNSGAVTSTGSVAVLMNGGSVTNNAGATILATGTNAAGLQFQTAAGTLTNAGTITGVGSGVSAGAGSALTVDNSGQISATTGNGINLSMQGGTITNSGVIAGGTDTTSYAVHTAAGTVTITNNGTITGGGGGAISIANGTVTVNLNAGSTTTGNIVATGSGTRSINISGTLDGSYSSTGLAVDTVALHNGGSINGADLGGGDDTFLYYGGTITGMIDGGEGNDALFGDFGAGNSATVSLASFINFESFGVLSGDATITGPSANPATAIYAGVGGVPSGTITFIDTANLTGDIYVNGGSIRANTAGAFGTGTIHMIDPTATFGATGTYANNISLEVVSPSSADPATLNTDAGVVATLTGAITTGSGAGIDPAQQLVIGGAGTIVLTNAANSWAGTTIVNAGATLQGTSASISGSAIVANGTLAYQQAASGTVAQGISGSGNVQISGLAAGNTLTFSGNNVRTGSFVVLDGSAIAFTGVTNTGAATSVVLAGAGGSVTNSGSITGATGVQSTGTGTTVDNYGSIAGGTAFNMSAVNLSGADTVVINRAGAALTGWRGVVVSGANAVITNYGTVTGTVDNALSLDNGGSATNALGGVLNATAPGGWGIYLNGTGTATNDGTINADVGIVFSGTGAHTATNTGTINGITGGVATLTGAGAASLINSGTIAVTTGSGVSYVSGGTVTNSGTITGGTNGYGIATTGSTMITNQAGGTISGGLGALYLDGAATTLVTLDAGSTTIGTIASVGTGTRIIGISGTLDGDYLGGDGMDTVTIDTGATVTGPLSGGAGSDLLQLNGTGSATLANTVTGFESVTKLGSGTWTLTGANDAAYWTIYGGTLVTGGAIGDAAQVDVAAAGTLQLSGDEAIGALSGSGTVALGSNTLALLAGTTSFDGTLAGTGNLLIDGANLTLGGTAGHSGLTEIRTGSLTLAAGAAFDPASTLLVGTAGTLDMGTTDATVALAALQGVLNGTGTLTASEYQLTGATVNANLGAGTVFNLGGTSTLNGTAAGNVSVQAGTLALGAANRLADTATVAVASGATLDIGAFDDTIGTLGLSGTLAGTGTLTAGEYQLTGATVNANLGTGTVFNLGGSSVLNGTAAGNVSVQAGTLTLGAANRLADTATMAVASGATLDIGVFDDTVGTLGLGGALAGTGTLTASEYQLTGATVNANLGTGTVFNLGGTSTLNGTAAGNVSVQAGTLTLGAANRLADTAEVAVASGATLDIGAFDDTIGTLGLGGTLAGTGTLTASQYQLTGATVNANLGTGA